MSIEKIIYDLINLKITQRINLKLDIYVFIFFVK